MLRFKYAENKVNMEVVHDGIQIVDIGKSIKEQAFIGAIKII